jgi:hypothetical protein
MLSGCSTIKLAYNQADHIIMWMADDYFDLSSDQKGELHGHIHRFHAWHRSTQLGDYAGLLEAVHKRLEAGVKDDDVYWAIDSLKARYRSLVVRGHADVAQVLSTLTDEQLNATRRQFEKGNRKFAKEYGLGQSPDEQRRLRAKRNVERIEHWTGPLTSAQETTLREISRALPLVTDLRNHDRLRRQREFLDLLKGRKDVGAFSVKLRDWLIDWDRTRQPEYEAALSRFLDASAKMYVEMFAQLTPEQRRHVGDRLRRYIVAFRELARESVPPTAAVQP